MIFFDVCSVFVLTWFPPLISLISFPSLSLSLSLSPSLDPIHYYPHISSLLYRFRLPTNNFIPYIRLLKVNTLFTLRN